MKKILVVLSLLLSCEAALAGGQFTDQLPALALPTGDERVPADTNLPQGRMPQTVFLTVNQMRSTTMQQSTPLTGFSITVLPGTGVVQLTPAGTLAAGTIVFPTSVVNGFRLRIFSTQTITALTLTPGTGQTINAAITTLAANTAAEYVFQQSNLTWFRVQ